jgi:hypothetical protein
MIKVQFVFPANFTKLDITEGGLIWRTETVPRFLDREYTEELDFRQGCRSYLSICEFDVDVLRTFDADIEPILYRHGWLGTDHGMSVIITQYMRSHVGRAQERIFLPPVTFQYLSSVLTAHLDSDLQVSIEYEFSGFRPENCDAYGPSSAEFQAEVPDLRVSPIRVTVNTGVEQVFRLEQPLPWQSDN